LLVRRQQFRCGPDLVDDVDGLVGKIPVVYIFTGKLGRGTQRFGRKTDAVMGFVKFIQALKYIKRLVDRRLIYIALF
jgi:hypothetical protein